MKSFLTRIWLPARIKWNKTQFSIPFVDDVFCAYTWRTKCERVLLLLYEYNNNNILSFHLYII